MSYGYTPMERDDEESVRVIHRALELGVDLLDTADVYGPFSNEKLLGRALNLHRHGVKVATKCGLVAGVDGKLNRNGRPEYIKAACEASLRRLRVEAIDLYQLHRVDPEVPLDDTWGALAELVTEGKVRALGISHATGDELERVHAVFPVTAVQYELSVWATRSRDEVLPWCQKSGVGFLAFAPVGRGYLSGILDHTALGLDDSRSRDPRFSADAMIANRVIVRGLRRIGARHGATPAQVAIAWTMAQSDNVVPIPGTRRLRWLEENVAAADLQLTAADLRDIDNLPAPVGEMSWDDNRSNSAARPAAEARPASRA
jgi:aryl-alcohol dehydrogenase-like predicted oxidoreductase